jgi:hypothetical protein
MGIGVLSDPTAVVTFPPTLVEITMPVEPVEGAQAGNRAKTVAKPPVVRSVITLVGQPP